MKNAERLIKVMTFLGLNKNSLSKEIGLDNNVTIGRIINEDRKPSQGTLKKIVARFPQIDYDWLLTGEGDMLKQTEPIEAPLTNNANAITIPMEAWDVIRNQAASLKAKDEQMADVISSLKARDRQVDEVIALLKEQVKKGQGVGDYGHVVPGAAQG